MAAASNENKVPKVGFQQFPETISVIPDEKEMAERVCLSLNSKDGQKTIGQSIQDPYTQALKYIEQHRIVEVFQNITARIAFEKPDDPLQFTLDEIEKIRKGEKLHELQ